jgi:hypothetical protein
MSNLVYDAMLRYAPHSRRRTPGGWWGFNCVCCVHNGQARPDTRNRGGIKLSSDNVSVYNCHNCKFKASWAPGRQLSKRMKDLLGWMGMPTDEVKKLDFKAWQIKSQHEQGEPTVREYTRLEFKETTLPLGAQPLSHWLSQPTIDPDCLAVAQYLADRGEAVLAGYEYYWTPNKKNNLNRRLLIPFLWEGKTVGWTARAIFPTKERYYGDTPLNYLFNTQVITHQRKFILLNEGVLDATAIDGVGTMGDKITPDQCQWLNHTGKEIIVLPDREKNGGALVDVAIQQGWNVSFPRWDKGVKDAAQATQMYGKLYALWSVIDARTNNRLEINVKRKMLLK